MEQEVFDKAAGVQKELTDAKMERATLKRAIDAGNYKLEFSTDGCRHRNGFLYLKNPRPIKKVLEQQLGVIEERIEILEKEFKSL